MLVAIGRDLVATNASLSAGILWGMTQFPGNSLSQRLLGTAVTLWQLDAVMAAIQIIIFGLALHVLSFAWRRVRRSDKKP